MTAEFPVVTEEEFPDGLVCIRCKRPIEPGQPYNSGFLGFMGDTMTAAAMELVCVYC